MVSSVNQNSQAQYERRFSLSKAATSAATGAALFKVTNDALMRRQANNTISLLRSPNADQYIKSANISKETVKTALKDADSVVKNTEYLSKIKNAVKSPKETISKIADKVTTTVKKTSVKDIPSKAKGFVTKFAEKAVKTAKSFKGETLKETMTNVLKATKTAKGKQVVNVALGAVCGLLLFGATKVKKTKEQA